MDNGVLFVLAAMLLCWSKGCSQTMSNNILSKTEVEAGGSFTVTCDASRAAVPADASIGSVLVQLNNGSEKIVVAKYWTFAPILSVRDPSRIFPVRNWTYNFDGSLRGTADRPKNRNTMRIEIYAVDAKCQDAGSYFCIVEYLVGTSNTLITKESYQTLVVKGELCMHY
ncbi:uncharacterized protein LOC131945864 [Physella acuta]|uniref:uncharacterized protein LOC131945864 n=1 Tax=Physella acuta TaxID=109671 RepID=UPI0027DE205B|nr:uncharacterized protein LOC131945864 [Physella acuta]